MINRPRTFPFTGDWRIGACRSRIGGGSFPPDVAPLAATFKTDTSICHWLITRYCPFVYFWASGKQKMKQNMEIISMDVKAFDALAGHVEAIERKAEALCRRQEDVSLKKWLDNQDVCDVLGIETYPANLPGERVAAFQPHPSQNLLQTGRCRETAAIVALS